MRADLTQADLTRADPT
ncbi:hypothetical protein K7864_28475 [Streptomyces sp. SP2-10]|nr:hypothetical protein [Streptomyces sp. SP2-10]